MATYVDVEGLAKEMEQLFPRHAAGLTLEHNEHKNNYETMQRWEDGMRCGHEGESYEETGWVSEEQRAKAFATDSVWLLHWYPDTPVGFIRLIACDLDVLLVAALARQGKK